jgi:two-component system, NtrC family, sensor histidine kinase PilS
MLRPDEELKQKVVMMMTFRMVIIITLLGSAILIQLVSRTILPINPLYFLIFLTSFFTLVSALWFAQIRNLRVLAYLQLSGDVLVVTLLLYFTGGVRSPFSFLYILVIIAASIIVYRRGALYIAAISSILYGLLVDLLYLKTIPYYDLQPSEISEISVTLIYYYIFIHIFGFFTTAFLSSYLSERLRRAKTELKVIDEDLSDLKILHQKIIDSMNTGLVLTDLDGHINFINGAGLQILDQTMHQILGEKIQTLFVENIDLENVRHELESTRQVRLERSLMKNKEVYLIGMNLAYLPIQKDSPYGMILVFQDITEVHKKEQQLKIQERMVAIGTMAAGIAHEIRNPLAAIHGSVQMLKNELHLSDDQQKLMEIVLTESVRLDHTIQHFLNFAKPKRFNPGREDLISVVTDTLSFIQKSPEFTDDHHISFSKSSEEFVHEFDSNQIKQVIWNLAINALHAMPNGGSLLVSLEHDLQGNVVLTFKDEGKGIESGRLDSIFDPFQTSTTGGSGLGMAIVYRIVQDHRGRINIDSKPDAGTTIVVRLPAKSTRPALPLVQ